MNRAMPVASPETTELERRVLDHEQLLQALIAFMARTNMTTAKRLIARKIPLAPSCFSEKQARPTSRSRK